MEWDQLHAVLSNTREYNLIKCSRRTAINAEHGKIKDDVNKRLTYNTGWL
jgi:hypothetical protein